MKKYKYLIVGGGMAADAAAKGIREVDDKKEIGVISADDEEPYARPPLSKGLWKDKLMDSIWMGTKSKGVDLNLSRTVVSIDAAARQVKDEQGDKYGYDKLLLATGGSPRKLPFHNAETIYYRTLGDYRLLRDMTEKHQKFLVLGGGFIGSEIAAALAMNSKDVTMVFPEAGVCSRMLPLELSEALNEYYRDKGVSIISSCKPSEIEKEDGLHVIHLDNSQTLKTEGVIAGIGIVPNTGLAESMDLDVDNGIVVDEQLRTGQENIFSSGDVANFYNPLLDARVRTEHEDNAMAMGEAAGRNMAGENESYHYLPFFYSDLFDSGYEAVGKTDSSLQTITDVKKHDDKGPIFYMDKGRVMGVVFWNMFGKVEAGRELIAAPGPHSEDGLRKWAHERLSQ